MVDGLKTITKSLDCSSEKCDLLPMLTKQPAELHDGTRSLIGTKFIHTEHLVPHAFIEFQKGPSGSEIMATFEGYGRIYPN